MGFSNSPRRPRWRHKEGQYLPDCLAGRLPHALASPSRPKYLNLNFQIWKPTEVVLGRWGKLKAIELAGSGLDRPPRSLHGVTLRSAPLALSHLSQPQHTCSCHLRALGGLSDSAESERGLTAEVPSDLREHSTPPVCPSGCSVACLTSRGVCVLLAFADPLSFSRSSTANHAPARIFDPRPRDSARPGPGLLHGRPPAKVPVLGHTHRTHTPAGGGTDVEGRPRADDVSQLSIGRPAERHGG